MKLFIKNIFGSVVSRLSIRILTFSASIITARLLGPDEFGIVGYAVVTIAILNAFTEFGVKMTLIQYQGNVKPLLKTAFTINIIRGLIIGVILFLSSEFISVFFSEPRLEGVIKLISTIPLLIGFKNINMELEEKNSRFSKIFRLEIISSVVSFISVISLALILKNAYAIIISQILLTITQLLLSYVFFKPKFALGLNQSSIKIIFKYGKWYFSSSLLFFGYTQFDKIIVGKIFSTQQLGLYQLANSLIATPLNEISKSFSRVLFPSYSNMQENKIKLKKSFSVMVYSLSFVNIFVCLFIFLTANFFVNILLGEKWLESIELIKYLSIAYAVNGVMNAGKGIFSGTGNPKIMTYISLIKTSVLFVFYFLLFESFGIIGFPISLIIANMISLFFWIYFVSKILKMTYKDWLFVLFPLILSLVTCLFLLLLNNRYTLLSEFYLHSSILFIFVILFLFYSTKSKINYLKIITEYLKK